MSTGAILVGVAMVVLVAIFLARPFMVSRPVDKRIGRRRQLLNEKTDLLEKIRQLEFDHETGNIPTALYEHQRPQLVQQAAAVLQQLEQLGVTDPVPTPVKAPAAAQKKSAPRRAPSRAERLAAIETAVASRRETTTPVPQAAPALATTGSGGPAPVTAPVNGRGHEPEPERDAGRREGEMNFCPQCGTKLAAADRFCANCGYKITE